jgi:hypothetical protein
MGGLAVVSAKSSPNSLSKPVLVVEPGSTVVRSLE